MPDGETDESASTDNSEATQSETESRSAEDPSGSRSQADLPAWADAQIKDLRKEAANYRTRAKALEAERDSKIAAISKERDEAQAAHAEVTREVARLRVAQSKGLTPEQAKWLAGDDEDTLAKSAEELLEAFRPGTPGRVKEALRGGSDPAQEPMELDPAKLAAKIRRNPF